MFFHCLEPSSSVACRTAKKILAVDQTTRLTKMDDGCVYPGSSAAALETNRDTRTICGLSTLKIQSVHLPLFIKYKVFFRCLEPSPSVACRTAKKILAVDQTKRLTEATNECVYPGAVWPLEGPIDLFEFIASRWYFTRLMIMVTTMTVMIMIMYLLQTELVADAIARRSGSLHPRLSSALSRLTGRSIPSQITL